MRKFWIATTLVVLSTVSGGVAFATTEPPAPDTDAELAAVNNSFSVWAASEGTPVSRVACSVQDDTATCYGTTVDETAVGASALLGQPTSDLAWDRLDGPGAAPLAAAPSTAGPTTTVPTTAVPTTLPPTGPFPIAAGATGPAVAAIQGRLGTSVDCDYGNQTRGAVEQWQQEAGIPVTGTIDEAAWALLDVPTTWGTDADGNGTIEPDEVTLVCDGQVELPPPPVDTTGWPDTTLALVAEFCSIPDEFAHPDDDSPDFRYGPGDDTITIFGAGAEDYPERGEQVLDTLVCVLGMTGVPDRIINQITATRALDGMQTASWDEFNAQWTYHPDAGLNITIWSS